MAKLYYGNGNCSIEGSNIAGVQIHYKGAITITDKTSAAFAITQQANGIVIFPINIGTLSELFDYEGEFKITSIIVADSNGEKVPTTIHRVMDYSELLKTNAEDMTNLSEDLKATHTSGSKPTKTTLLQSIIPNLNTSNWQIVLYLKDRTKYNGLFHIHLKDNSAMTGGQHTEESEDLYFKQSKKGEIIDNLVPTRNPSLQPQVTNLQKRGKGSLGKIMKQSEKKGY